MTNTILANLVITFFLAACMGFAWWWLIRLVNRSTGVNVREVLNTIHTDPVASAIYRAAIVVTAGMLVIAAFGRYI